MRKSAIQASIKQSQNRRGSPSSPKSPYKEPTHAKDKPASSSGGGTTAALRYQKSDEALYETPHQLKSAEAESELPLFTPTPAYGMLSLIKNSGEKETTIKPAEEGIEHSKGHLRLEELGESYTGSTSSRRRGTRRTLLREIVEKKAKPDTYNPGV